MEMSVREAKAKFSAAIAAAERGESVLITKNGKVVAQIAPPQARKPINLAAGDAYLKQVGWNPQGLDLWPTEFDDPAFSRRRIEARRLRLVLDTHIALWLAADRNRLSAAELAIILDPANMVAVSTVSIWELRSKWNRLFRSGDRKGPVDPGHLLVALDIMGIPVEPLLARHSVATLDEPIAHSDPFDELLLAIAQETGARLLTRDAALAGHPLALSASG